MALNVYLTVFRKYSSHRLQKLEIRYVLICYGVPFIPSVIFLFIKKNVGGVEQPLFGPATLWCWISDDWQFMRLAVFYGPIWLALAFTIAIYVLAGKVIFKLRESLRLFARADMSSIGSGTAGFGTAPGTISSINAVKTSHPKSLSPGDRVAGTPNTSPVVPILSDPSPVAVQHSTTYSCVVESTGKPGLLTTISTARQKNAVEANTAAWAYCRCAMLFFLALVVTWLPSSVNRIYTVIYPGTTNFSLYLASALVLPCQGFWNGLIYTITTLPACKQFLLQGVNRLRVLVGMKPLDLRRPRRNVHRSDEGSVDEPDIKKFTEGRMEAGRLGMGNHYELQSIESIRIPAHSRS